MSTGHLKALLQTIPSDLRAEDESTFTIAPANCAKTLGLQLPSLTNHPIRRYVATSPEDVIDRQLHGFGDASTVAYGGVVYLRLLHSDTCLNHPGDFSNSCRSTLGSYNPAAGVMTRGWSYEELSFWPNCLSQLLLICPSPPIMCTRGAIHRWYWDGSTDLQPSSKCLLPTG